MWCCKTNCSATTMKTAFTADDRSSDAKWPAVALTACCSRGNPARRLDGTHNACLFFLRGSGPRHAFAIGFNGSSVYSTRQPSWHIVISLAGWQLVEKHPTQGKLLFESVA